MSLDSGSGSLDKATQMAMYEFQNLDWISTDVDPIVVLNKWYTPLPPTRNVKGWYLIVEQTNNGATAEDLELELTIDGTVFGFNMAALASGIPRYILFVGAGTLAGTNAPRQMLSLEVDQSAPLETRSLQIRVRQTSAVDVVAAQIEVNMVYETREVSA